MNNLMINNELLSKVAKLKPEEEKLLMQTINVCFETNIKPNLPEHLLILYYDIRDYNIDHNEEFRKKVEALDEE